MSHPPCYTITSKMIKNKKEQNVVSTTRKQNLAAVKTCETFNEAIQLFRALEWANDRGTSGWVFEELEEYFINKQGLEDYLKNGFTVAQASDKKVKETAWQIAKSVLYCIRWNEWKKP